MDGQQQRASRSRRRRQRRRSEPQAKSEPVLIAARRPNSPVLQSKPLRQVVVASATPSPSRSASSGKQRSNRNTSREASSLESPPRRAARIVQFKPSNGDEQAVERQKLLDRLLASEGRGAISHAANQMRLAGFEFPVKQEVQLQLLEHFDEECALAAIKNLTMLLEHESPIKRPIFEQRLRRLEEYADDPATREAAATLRRAFRN